MQKTTSGPAAKAEIAKQDAVKKRAARQAAKRELAPEAHETVECVVLPQGHEKISMGEHVGGLGEAHYEEDETFTVELPIALALYERGYVNFEGARQAQQDARAARAAEAAREAAEAALLNKQLSDAGLK